MNLPIHYPVLAAILLLCSFPVFGQSGKHLMGARAFGMAETSVSLQDEWSLFQNPGAMADRESAYLLLGYQNRFISQDFQSLAAGYVQPFAWGVMGLSLYRFGRELYNEQQVSLAFSNRFGLVSLGLEISYLQYHFEGLGKQGIPLINFGGLAELNPQLYFGAHISNMHQAKMNNFLEERVPTVLRAGLSWQAVEKLLFSTEAEKDMDYPTSLKAGLEYQVHEVLFLRTGFKSQPYSSFGGLGLNTPKIQVDYGFANDLRIGWNHQVSVTYQLGASQKKNHE